MIDARLPTLCGLLMLLCSGCAQAVWIGIDDTREGHVETPAPIIVAEACDLLGVECELADQFDHPPVLLVITQGCETAGDEGDQVCGRARGRGCRRTAWAVHDRPLVVAHELGHLLGLNHVDDPDNLMHPKVGDELTDKQRRIMDRHIERLGACP